MTATLAGGTLREETARPPRQLARWLRTLVICLLLALLPFVTAPGEIIADTKLNLVINPAGFLDRALTLWDPQFFGELQNQAIGYLFPMGPFFALGKLMAVPPWIIQRLWIAALLIAAYWGMVRLAERFGIGTPWTQIMAGLAYALSPIALSMTGEMSGEFLQMAMLPWILLPLASAARGQTTPARAAIRSAVAVALCSGMNAASTIAVLVPAVIYILTARGVPRRGRLLIWWGAVSLAATWWWSVPLVLLSRYGVSPVPYTESAAATTAVTSLSNVLRGTSDWLSYLSVNGQPWWPLGFRIATGVLPVLLTGVIAALGLSGLLTRIPERRFLLCSLLAGVLLIAAGYVGPLGNPLSGPLDHLINGAASPFRNLWKFDPLVRLPIAFGLAHLLATRDRWAGGRFAAAGVAIVGVALPAYVYGLATPGSLSSVPSYWTQAADWLNAHAGHQDVLIEPGSAFGQYDWGSPLDEVLSPLTSVDYAERDLGDISSPGNERLLEAIDQRFAAGDGSAGLTRVLARMGVTYLVIRNDLNRATLGGAWPARVHQTIAESPGITRVAKFGTFTGTFVPDDAATNFDSPYPPVEIYRVAGALPVATVQPTAGTVRVYGGPESLLTLADESLLGHKPVLLDNDGAGQQVAGSVVTDSLRRRVRNFGEIRASYSPTLTATQPADTFEATDDYTEPGWNRYQSVARYVGIQDVTASSSASDVEAIPGQWSSGELPFAAVDGNTRTYWESGNWTGPAGQWIQENFDSRIAPGVISVAFDTSAVLGPAVTQVRVSTAAGAVTDPVAVTSQPQLLRVPSGRTGWLRITVTGLASRAGFGAQVGIYEIYVPGVQAARTIVAPSAPGGSDPAAVILSQDEAQPSGCMLTSLRWVCSPSLETSTEEQYGFDRTFEEPYAEPAVLRGSAILTDPALVSRFARLSPGQPLVSASSVYTSDPQDQALSAFDGNPATAWVASPTDSHPTLRVQWSGARTVSRVTIQRPPGSSGLLQVIITGSRGQFRGAWIGAGGIATFKPMRTTSLTFAFNPSYAPVQITDVDIPGVPHFGPPSGTFRLSCGLGPYITLNGKVIPTKVSGTFTDLLTEQPVQFTACSSVTLAGGSNRLVEPATDAFTIQNAAVLGMSSVAPASDPVAATVLSWTASARSVRVYAPVRSYLAVNENFNTGWQAVVNGEPLQPIRLDGWKQGWILPAGTAGVVRMTFRPQSLFRFAVWGGLGALGLILLAAVFPRLPPRRPRVREARALRPAGRLLRGVGVVVLCGVGLWLGGYPGAVIVPLAALAALVIRTLKIPWVVGALMLVAAVSGAIGTHLQVAGSTGWPVSVLLDAMPQVLLLVLIGALAAELLRGGADGDV